MDYYLHSVMLQFVCCAAQKLRFTIITTIAVCFVATFVNSLTSIVRPKMHGIIQLSQWNVENWVQVPNVFISVDVMRFEIGDLTCVYTCVCGAKMNWVQK